MSYQSFAITHRPKFGLNDLELNKFCLWVQKHCKYYLVGIEKENESRHLHAGLYFNKSKTKGDIFKMLLCIFDLSDAEKYVLKRGLKVMYDGNFISSYIGNADKGDYYKEVIRNIPESRYLEGYYPKKNDEQLLGKRKREVDPEFAYWEQLWYETQNPSVSVTRRNVLDWHAKMVNKMRKLCKLRDKRTIIYKVQSFTDYLKKRENYSFVSYSELDF